MRYPLSWRVWVTMVGGSKSKVAIAVGFVVVAVVAFIAGRESPKVEIRHQDTLKPLADRTNAAPPPPENPGESPPVNVGWQVYEEKSAMDDTPTVTLSLMAKDSINTDRGVQTPSLQIRCREKSTDIYIINGAPANPELGVEGATVRLRIDSAPAFSQVWDKGTDWTILFATNSISLAKQLAGAKTLLYEFTPFNSDPQQTTFELSGLADQLPKVAATCGWEI